jgi:hypothetical protein
VTQLCLKLTVALKPRVRGLGKRRVRKALARAASILDVQHEALRGALREILDALQAPKDTLKALNGGGEVAFDGVGYDPQARVAEALWRFQETPQGTAAAARMFGHLVGVARRLNASGLPTQILVTHC